MMFDLSSACYNVMLLVVLLEHVICVEKTQTCKTDSINQIYQIMVVSILKN